MNFSDPSTIILTILAVLFVAWLIHLPSAIRKENEEAAREDAERAEMAARPYRVVGVNGETALVERWNGTRIDVTNAFPELYAEMLVALDWRCTTIVDYINPEDL